MRGSSLPASYLWRLNRRPKLSNEEKKKRAEQQITDELANQARMEPGSPEEESSKEKRAQAEREHREAREA
jgi:hypothetical protein